MTNEGGNGFIEAMFLMEKFGTQTPTVEQFLSEDPRLQFAYSRMLSRIGANNTNVDFRVDLGLSIHPGVLGYNSVDDAGFVAFTPKLLETPKYINDYLQEVMLHELRHTGEVSSSGRRVISESFVEASAQKRQREISGEPKIKAYEEDVNNVEDLLNTSETDEEFWERLTGNREVMTDAELGNDDLVIVNNVAAMLLIDPIEAEYGVDSLRYGDIRKGLVRNWSFLQSNVGEHLNLAHGKAMDYRGSSDVGMSSLVVDGLLARSTTKVLNNNELLEKVFADLTEDQVIIDRESFNNALQDNDLFYLVDYSAMVNIDLFERFQESESAHKDNKNTDQSDDLITSSLKIPQIDFELA